MAFRTILLENLYGMPHVFILVKVENRRKVAGASMEEACQIPRDWVQKKEYNTNSLLRVCLAGSWNVRRFPSAFLIVQLYRDRQSERPLYITYTGRARVRRE